MFSKIGKITEELTKNFSSKIKLNYKHDESLIGGLVVQVGSTMVDTSIKNKLQKIEKNHYQQNVLFAKIYLKNLMIW